MAFYLEVGPLQESTYSGIATVVLQLANQMLVDTEIDTMFFFERQRVPDDLIRDLIGSRNGAILKWIVGNSRLPLLSVLSDPESVGIFGNVKTGHRLFHYEAQIIHDLSFFVTPQFHTESTIRYHSERFERDIATNDLNICVSHHTSSDLQRYFPDLDRRKILVAHNGWSWPPEFASLYAAKLAGREQRRKPFLLVLGTLEPRKNVDVVLSDLSEHPALLDKYDVVFAGAVGWGSPFEEKLRRLKLTRQFGQGRILATGYVSEFSKYCLLRQAEAVIYPSLFEGFGLPVVEALSLGKAIVTTKASSIPEVGGDAVFYFDPFVPDSFAQVLQSCLARVALARDEIARRAQEQAALFGWQKFYTTIKQQILGDLSRTASGKP